MYSENSGILHSATRRSLFGDEFDDVIESSLPTIQQYYSGVPDAPNYPERQPDSSGMNETETALCPEQLCSPKFAPMVQETASLEDSLVLAQVVPSTPALILNNGNSLDASDAPFSQEN